MDVLATFPITLIERRHEYGDVFSYFFEPSKPIPFIAGSYAHLRLLSLPEDTRRVREISFASAPQEDLIQFGIDHGSGSDYQKAFMALKEGEFAELFKIKSHMSWAPAAKHVVMIAGGIGVTPFRSMLKDKVARDLPFTTTLIHVSSGDLLYRNELVSLADEYLISDRVGLAGQIQTAVTEHTNAHYYVAGSPTFTETVSSLLGAQGITKIETDPFKGLTETL